MRVTIGFTPRERFSLAGESLQRLFDCTEVPFRLIVVDANTPEPYRQQMQRVLDGRDNVEVIRTDGYLRPSESKNLVVAGAEGDYLCLIENDVLVQDGWLPRLIAACEEHPADVAVPLIIEGPLGSGKVHFDDLLGSVRTVEGPRGPRLEILPRSSEKERDHGAQRRTVEFMEQHCLLFRRSVFDRIGPFDEQLNTRDEIDLSLALRHAGVPVVFEPECAVHYLPPYPPEPEELEFFLQRWDLDRAAASRERIRDKWDLVETPGDLGFVQDRNLIGQLHRVREELSGLAGPGDPIILVDQAQWLDSQVVEGLNIVPFLERKGQYWGAPPDDETAIAELERLRRAGASFVAFAWFTYWWLTYYQDFADHLERFPRRLENDRLTVFDLRKPVDTPS